ncbi:MAG: PEGA domain-containing protein, partial [Myxococcota bacterium]
TTPAPSKPAAAAKPATPPPRAPPVPTDPGVDLGTGDDDVVDHGSEDDGATIPVYDLKSYEEERLRRHAEEGGKRPNLPAARDRSARDIQPSSEARTGPAHALDTGSGDAGDFDEAPTRNLDGLVLQAKLAQSRMGASPDGGVAASAGAAPAPAAARGTPPPRNGNGALNGSHALDANITAEESAPNLPRGNKPPPPKPAPPPPKAAEPPPPPAVTDDEVVPGLGPPRIRPAAEIKPAAQTRPAADARPVQDSVRPTGDVKRPTREVESVAVPPSVEGAAPGSSRLPPVKRDASSTALPAVAPPAEKPKAVVIAPVPVAQQAPSLDVPPPPPPRKNANKGILIIAGAAVFALVVSVFVVMSILDTGEVPPPQDAPSAGATGKIMVKTEPKGCEIWVDGKQQDVPSPSLLGGQPVGRPVTVMVKKAGYAEARETVTLTKENGFRADLNFTLEKKK